MKNHQSANTIHKIINARIEAIKQRNVSLSTNNYASMLTLFDVVGPLEHKSEDAVKKRLSEWFQTFDETSPIEFEMAELMVEADETIAFSHSLNHINVMLANGNNLDMWWRETQNWIKINNAWMVVHTHSSVPFDPKTGKSLTNLKPR